MAENNPKIKRKAFPLKQSSEFTNITKKGRKIRASSYLTLVVLSSEDNLSYFGITASKKVGNAVLRNKLKRWVRNCVQSENWLTKFYAQKVVFMFRAQQDGFYDKLKYKDFCSSVLD